MKGFIRTTFAGLCLGSSALALGGGCAWYRDVVDPCYPDRYNAEARSVLRGTFDNQAFNGHVLDQTIWNYHFEHDERGNPTDRLTVAGQDRLKYIVRRRPTPDGKVYLQTANDIPIPVTEIESLPGRRQDLDARRAQAIQRFLTADTAGRNCMVAWDVAIHDAAPTGLPSTTQGGALGAVNIIGSYPKHQTSFQGALPAVAPFAIPAGGTGTTGAATGAAAGPGSGPVGGTTGGTTPPAPQGGGGGPAGGQPGGN
jgi:hypothetical protein